MTDMHFFVLADRVLGLRTNVHNMTWSYGITPPSATEEDYSRCAVRLQLIVSNLQSNYNEKQQYGKYHYFFGRHYADELYYDRAFLFNARLRLQAKGLVSGKPTLRINNIYHRFIKYRFMNLHSAGYILTDMASLALLRAGYAPLHCSAFQYRDSTVVIFAPPNTGKTLSTMMACLDYGANYIGEDLAITDGTLVFSVPWTSTFRYYDQVDNSIGTRILNAAIEKVPLLELFSPVQPKPITDYLGKQQSMITRSKVTHLIILERDVTPSVQPVNKDEAIRKIVNLNRYEFNYYRAPLVVAYEFFNPTLDIDGTRRSETRIISDLVHSTDEIFVAKAKDPTEYSPLIMETLN